MRQKKLAVVVLAAGKGTRMKSERAKVLHSLGGRPLLAHVLDSVAKLEPDRVLVVVGFQGDEVRARFRDPGLEFVEQAEQLGTGHAVRQTEGLLKDFDGDVLILCGDMPFIKTESLERLVRHHRETGAQCTLLSLKHPEPRDFGRVVRDAGGKVVRIVENRDATAAEKTIDEYNSGVYCFNKSSLFNALGKTGKANSQGEYYLTDVVQSLAQSGLRVECVQTNDADEIFGINSIADLERAEQILHTP